MQRALGIIWAAVCLAVAGATALQMFVTFAPSEGRTGELAAAELAGLERARNAWWTGAWAASALLAVSGIAIAALAWKRR